jgi:hypothetical protein
MKRSIYSPISLILLFIIFLMPAAPGQLTGCKVLLPSISGSYSGKCKNGLAHGKGIAQGTDYYEGEFSYGVPQGKGTYKWANGSVFTGQWIKGQKEGRGEMVYHTLAGDSVVRGYWTKDNYVGDHLIPPYKINRSQGVVRSSIRRISDKGSDVIIKILLGGLPNTEIEEFSMAYDNGSEYSLGSAYGIQNSSFPLDLKIRYRTWNQLHTIQYDVVFDLTINDPGKWDVTIFN